MIKYKNLWKGKIIDLTADEFDDKLSNLDSEYKVLINSVFLEYEVESFSKSNDVIYFNLISKDKNVYRFALANLKNSGNKNPNQNNKRFYIHNNIPNYKQNSQYFLIGLYNAGDKLIYAFSEASEFVGNYLIRNANSEFRSYSSFWLRFEQLIDHYESERDYTIKEKTAKGREHVYGVVYLTKKLKFEEIIKHLGAQKSIEKKSIKLSDEVYAIEKILLLRNNKLREQAFKNSNYTCENCGKRETFISKDGTMYFEAHHIIPFNITTHLHFDSSLDCLENISCLCAECHRKIHYSKDKVRHLILEKITKHKLIKKFKLGSNYIEIISKFYVGEESENDE
jgi:hypothetical protein